jgi:DNA-directed RNA polymerase specialized sigma24 family protein
LVLLLRPLLMAERWQAPRIMRAASRFVGCCSDARDVVEERWLAG